MKAGKPVEVSAAGQRTRFKLPSVQDYEVVVLE